MKEPLYWKVWTYISSIICKLTHHDYGCCSNICKNCNKCKKNK